MNGARTESAGLVIDRPKPGGGWTLRRWLMLVVLVFAAQVGFIFALGERHFKLPHAVTNAPQLRLADNSSDLVALYDPTLFALPHANDFASAVWLQTPAVPLAPFHWNEPLCWLPLASNKLGAVFGEFMRTNQFAALPLDFKPPPNLSAPMVQFQPAFAEDSTLLIEGDLAQRRLLAPLTLTNWPYPDVIAPSRVQVLVDAAGEVVSAVLLPSDNPDEAANRYDAADQRALELARTARFAPAARLTVGLLIFDWRTVPPPATNAPARLP